MRALRFHEQQLQLLESYPTPQPAAHEALIRIKLAGICATDLAILRGYKGFQGVLGHEFVGEVVACADSSWLQARIVGEINCGCGLCAQCRCGSANHCPQRTVLGISKRDGVFADYCTLPLANLHRLPASLSDQQGVLVEPLAAALRIGEQIHLTAGEPVAVVGDGRLGILVAHVLAASGCDLTVIGHHPEHQPLLPATLKAYYLPEEIPANLSFYTMIECSGSGQGLGFALSKVQPGGRIVLKSTLPSAIPLQPADWVVREVQIIGSRCGPFAKAIAFLQQQPLPIQALITACYPLEQAAQAITHARQKGALKVLIQP
ncbi:MAG: alcohol dehydrogenase catalytic domain-containing protein [Magnetococcales bacterium]|nr:alcohol dehydrogenase catalytic domain-containing protein [Magnetococcales bacterium]